MSVDQPLRPPTERVRAPGPLDDSRSRRTVGALAGAGALALLLILYLSNLPAPAASTSPPPSAKPPTPLASASATAAARSPSRSPTTTPRGSEAQAAHSDDGKVNVYAMPGAMPAGTRLIVTQHSVEEDPPELGDVTRFTGHYEVAPAGIRFGSAVQVTWHVPRTELGVRSDAPGRPVLAMALRADDGWQWLSDQSYAFTTDEVTLSGYLPELGAIFVLIGRMYVDARFVPGLDRMLGQNTRLRFRWTALDAGADPAQVGGAGLSITGDAVIGIGEGEVGGGYAFTLHCRGAPADALVSGEVTIANVPFEVTPSGARSIAGLAGGPGDLTFTMTGDVRCALRG